MNWEKTRTHIAVVDEVPHHIARVREALGDSCSVQAVCSPFKLLSLLCAEKPEVILMNSAVGWCRTDFLCKAINNDPVLAETPIVLYNTENTTVNASNVALFRNCHIAPDAVHAAATARRLINR